MPGHFPSSCDKVEHVSLAMSSPRARCYCARAGDRDDPCKETPMAIVHPVESAGGARRLRVASPVTKEPIGEVAVATAEEVRAAVRASRAVQPAWAALGPKGRAPTMRRALKILIERQEEYIDVIVRETGRSRME